jgi:hypothetical protein
MICFLYHTEYTTYIKPTAAGGTIQHFTDLFVPLYDSETYDDSTYTPDAYMVQTHDTGVDGGQLITKFDITANNAIGALYYRLFDDPGEKDDSISADWTAAGNIENGTKTVTINSDQYRFLQVAVLYDGIAWGDDLRITDVTVYYQSYMEWVYYSVYYLDTPNYTDPPDPLVPRVICKGRDAYKRAIGTEINLPDLSGGGALQADELIKQICDNVGIKYTSSSIDDLSAFGDITWSSGYGDIVRVDDVFENIMQKINPTGYQMYMQYDSGEDDNILFVKLKPDGLTLDGSFSYNNYINISGSNKNSDRIVQRYTVISNQQVVAAEETLDSTAYTTTGAKVQSWVGNAIYKTISIDKPDDITITNLVVNPTSIGFTISAITGTVTVTVKGNKWDSTEPTYQGEAINLDNMIAGKGTTTRVINPLLISDAECKTVAESFITEFATPAYEANSVNFPYINLLTEINDVEALYRRYINDDNAYFVSRIIHTWSRGDNPTENTTYNLEDTGTNLSDIYNFTYDDSPVEVYDKGFIYDQKLPKGGSDTNTYTPIARY